jgi:mRNA-degrading endonuclease RelE of RelBE toxin-antitoxin system
MTWTVSITDKAEKRIARLPKAIRGQLFFLIREIEAYGPVRGNWSNYGKLSKSRHHCHLKKGHPTYVAVWEVVNKEIKLVEVVYAGTHEKAPY